MDGARLFLWGGSIEPAQIQWYIVVRVKLGLLFDVPAPGKGSDDVSSSSWCSVVKAFDEIIRAQVRSLRSDDQFRLPSSS